MINVRAIALASFLTIFAPTPTGAAPDPIAERLFKAGDYAGAARAARLSIADPAGMRITLDTVILAADANERAEGTFADTESALRSAASITPAASPDKGTRARLSALRALLLVREGKPDEAVKEVLEGTTLLGKYPADPDAVFDLQLVYGRILLAKGLAAQAIGEIANVANHRLDLPNGDPRLLESLHWLGVAQFHGGKSNDAIGTLREVVRVRTLALGSDHPDTLRSRAMLAAALDDSDPAAATVERAAVLERWRARAVTGDARLAEALLDDANGRRSIGAADRFNRLKEAFSVATTATPQLERVTAEVGLALAKELRSRGRLGEALDVITTTISHMPQLSGTPLAFDVENTRAVLYLELQRPTEAEQIYRRLIAIYEADPALKAGERQTLMNNLADLLVSQGRVADAILLERKVVDARSAHDGPTAPLT